MQQDQYHQDSPQTALALPETISPALHAIVKPSTMSEYVAYGISQLGSPPVLGLFALCLIATTLTLSKTWPWFGLYLLLSVICPMSFLIWQLRSGHITDLDIQLREQRKSVLLVTVAGFVVTWLIMIIGQAPPQLTLMSGIGMLQWLFIFAITLRWKVSVHTTSATGVTMLILRNFGLSAAPLFITIPLIAWSRVKLRHHTPAQTIAGTALGIAIFLGAILISPAY